MVRWAPSILAIAVLSCGGSGPGGDGDGGALLSVDILETGIVESMRVARGPGDQLTVALLGQFGPSFPVSGESEAGESGRYLVLARYGPAREQIWMERFEIPFSEDIGIGLATAPNGDVFVTLEQLYDTVDLGGGDLIGQVHIEYHPKAGALARFAAASGEHLWSRVLEEERDVEWENGFENIVPQDIAVTAGGDLVLAGYGALGSSRAYLALLSAEDGAILWDQPLGPRAGRNQTGSRIFTSADGTAVVTSTDLPSDGWTTATITKVRTRTGEVSWEYHSPFAVRGAVEVAVDSRGDVVLASQLSLPEMDDMSPTVCVDKIAAGDGTHLWSWIIGTGDWPTEVRGQTIAIDPADNVVVAGSFVGPVLLGERVVSSELSALFVLNLDSNGSTRWSRYANTATGNQNNVFASDVLFAASNRVIATGFTGIGGEGWYGFRTERLFFLDLAP